MVSWTDNFFAGKAIRAWKERDSEVASSEGRIVIELMTSDRKLKASREGSK